MALEVYLQKDTNLPKTTDNRLLSFEDDGYFWFLQDFFEDLAKQTGQLIDLYDDAFFNRGSLDLLNQMIQRAKKEVSQKPEVWEEFIGTIVHKDERKVENKYSTVHKKELKSILMKLENAVTKAKEQSIGILFFGD